MQESGPCGNWNPHCDGRQHGRVCHDHNAENKSVGTSVVDVENYDVVILNCDAVKDKAAAAKSCELTKKFPSFKDVLKLPSKEDKKVVKALPCKEKGDCIFYFDTDDSKGIIEVIISYIVGEEGGGGGGLLGDRRSLTNTSVEATTHSALAIASRVRDTSR
ncbi:hypothetical protein SELMODRAFT_426619 [Selaginella moellendorffii]|uniref:Uncharacterized protein n=1 Tax=Selaginella moellendorffii TaxID=88036 RepID=D8SWY7_SELML|nr:hypothetical protein SELMODRAFT_426619 [Selaginella moellendorffii]